MYQGDKFFDGVVDWTQASQATLRQARQIKLDMFEKLPPDLLHQFTNSWHGDDGFAMIADLRRQLNPNTPNNRSQQVRDLGSFVQQPNETTSHYMERARNLQTRLTGVTIDQLMTTIVMTQMDQALYDGTYSRYTGGDPAVHQANLYELEKMMVEEVKRKADGGTDVSIAGGAARRVGSNQPPANTPTPRNSNPTPTPPAYPPEPLRWAQLGRLVDANTLCPVCFSPRDFCRTHSCPALAKKDLVIIEDKVAAKKILDDYAAVHPQRGSQNTRTPSRGGTPGRGGRSGGRLGARGNTRNTSTARPASAASPPSDEVPPPSDTPPAENPSPSEEPQSSGQRATSNTRPAESDNRFSQFREAASLSSDSDDDAGYEMLYGNQVDAEGELVGADNFAHE